MDEEKSDFGFDALSKSLERKLEGGEDPTATGRVEELNQENYATVIGGTNTAVVIFYHTTCQYCAQALSILDCLAKQYDKKVFFGKINTDDVEEEVLDQHKIYSVPLVIAFKKNRPVARIDGLKTTDVYDEWIEGVYKGIRPMS